MSETLYNQRRITRLRSTFAHSEHGDMLSDRNNIGLYECLLLSSLRKLIIISSVWPSFREFWQYSIVFRLVPWNPTFHNAELSIPKQKGMRHDEL